MNTNLLFIEGIPGSGKTTLAKRLYDKLQAEYVVDLRLEGELHPIDVCWCSILTPVEYHDLCNTYHRYQQEIEAHTKQVHGHYITAYTNVHVDDPTFYHYLNQKELFQVQDLQVFKEFYLSLYKDFNKTFKTDTLYLFECVFLQNHINEHILKYDTPFEELIQYFNDLLDEIPLLQPTLLYLYQTNPKNTFDRIVKERRSPHPGENDWIDNVVNYIAKQPYASIKGYTTPSDMLRYFTDRQELEQKLLPYLNLPVFQFNVDDNYDDVLDQMYHTVINIEKNDQ